MNKKRNLRKMVKALKDARETRINYPEETTSIKDKIKFVVNQFSELQSQHFSLSSSMMENRLRIGCLMMEFKRLVKKQGKSFKKQFEKKVSCISFRTAERYMQLAKIVDLKEHPALILLDQNQVLTLYKHLDHKHSETMGKFLQGHELELNFDLESEEDVIQFQTKVDALIDELDNDDSEADEELNDDDDYEKEDSDDNDDDEKEDSDDDDDEKEDSDDDDDEKEDSDDDDDETKEKNSTAATVGTEGQKKKNQTNPGSYIEKYKKTTKSLVDLFDEFLEDKSLIQKKSLPELKKFTDELESKLKKVKKLLDSMDS